MEDTLQDEWYRYIFSVEEVNKLVMQGIPFREAYKIIAGKIAEGTFQSDQTIHHTHAGSIGNLCNDMIIQKMEKVISSSLLKRKMQPLKNYGNPGNEETNDHSQN